MNLELVVGVLLLVALAYAWYTERKKRRDAELERDVATRRETLDGIKKELDAGKQPYEDAKKILDEHAVPSYMLDKLGQPTVVTELVTGAKVDVVSGERFATKRKPESDPSGPGEAGTVH